MGGERRAGLAIAIATLTAAAAGASVDVPWVLLQTRASWGAYAGIGASRPWWEVGLLWTAALLLPSAFMALFAPRRSVGRCTLFGLALGAVVYGVFNATALSAFDRWPLRAAAVDVVWGSALYAFMGFAFSSVWRAAARRPAAHIIRHCSPNLV